MVQNINEKNLTSRSHNIADITKALGHAEEHYDLDLSDNGDEDLKDENFRLLGQNHVSKLQDLGSRANGESGGGADLHNIEDDDLEHGIEPIQSSRTQNNQLNATKAGPELGAAIRKGKFCSLMDNEFEADGRDERGSISPVMHNTYQVSRKSVSAVSCDRSQGTPLGHEASVTFPTMTADDHPGVGQCGGNVKIQSARISDESPSAASRARRGLSIPSFNNNSSTQFQHNN